MGLILNYFYRIDYQTLENCIKGIMLNQCVSENSLICVENVGFGGFFVCFGVVVFFYCSSDMNTLELPLDWSL